MLPENRVYGVPEGMSGLHAVRKSLPALIIVTGTAKEKLRSMRLDDGMRLRVDVLGKGCAGFSYSMNRVQAPEPYDQIVHEDGEELFVVSPSASMWLTGATMDWEQTVLSQGFNFRNPNESGRCGCGKSFSAG